MSSKFPPSPINTGLGTSSDRLPVINTAAPAPSPAYGAGPEASSGSTDVTPTARSNVRLRPRAGAPPLAASSSSAALMRVGTMNGLTASPLMPFHKDRDGDAAAGLFDAPAPSLQHHSSASALGLGQRDASRRRIKVPGASQRQLVRQPSGFSSAMNNIMASNGQISPTGAGPSLARLPSFPSIADPGSPTNQRNGNAPGARVGTVTEFLKLYADEHRAFASEAVEAEWCLSRAEAMATGGDDKGFPVHLVTAVSLAVLDKVSSHFGDYSQLVSRVAVNLKQAIYGPNVPLEPPASVSPSSAAAKRLLKTTDTDTSRLQHYYGLDAYYTKYRDMQRQLAAALDRVEEMKAQLADERAAHEVALMNTKREMELKYVTPLQSATADADKLRSRLVQVSNELKDVKLKYAFGTPVERLCTLFDELDHYDQLEVARGLLGKLPDVAHVLAEYLLTDVISAENVGIAVAHTAKSRNDLVAPIVTDMVCNLLNGRTLSNVQSGASNVLAKVNTRFPDHASTTLQALVPLLSTKPERSWAARLFLGLSAIQTTPNGFGCLPQQLGGGVAKADLIEFDGVLHTLTKPETLSLARILMGMPHVQTEVGQTTSVEFVLGAPHDVRWQLLQALMSSVPADDICTLITCPFHDHARSETVAADTTTDGAASDKTAQNLSAMHKFLRKPPKSLHVPKFKTSGAVALIAECIEKKVAADDVDDREGNKRQDLPDFVLDFFLNKYGLPSICDGYAFALVSHIMKTQARNTRLRWFGKLIGVVDPPKYSAILADIVFNFLRQCFPKLSTNQLRNRSNGTCCIALVSVIRALNQVFPEVRPMVSKDTLWLNPERKAALIQQITKMSVDFSTLPMIDGSVLAEPPPAGLTVEEQRAVDVDEVVLMVMETWHAQMLANRERFCTMYHEFDTDGSNTLSFQEFSTLMRACCPEELPTKRLLTLFHEVRQLAGPSSGDCVSPESFATMCQRHGFTPP